MEILHLRSNVNSVDWTNWVEAHADISLCLSDTFFAGIVMLRLILYLVKVFSSFVSLF